MADIGAEFVVKLALYRDIRELMWPNSTVGSA